MIPESFIQQVVDHSDIEQVVSEYVTLTKKSGGNRFGLCPFHGEKTPSFAVNSAKQIYHCFGCGKGGGVINFIMEIENLKYPEAVEFLAKRAGLELPANAFDPDSRRRARMRELNREAARFFYEQLATPAGKAATDYMSGRGIDPRTAIRFGLGFAPPEWESLRRAMHAKGFSDRELVDACLIRESPKRPGSYYDFFSNRLMFPVIDVQGNVIGFSGRDLGEKGPKYKNTGDTLLYDKGRHLFGLNLAKKSGAGNLILCEGNVDVVSLHRAGFDSAVASLGTALTMEQAQLMCRFTHTVVIAYDSDAAGAKAAQRAIGILERLDLKVKVLQMTGAKDPDEFIKTRGAPAFQNLIDGAEEQVDYRLRCLKEPYNLSEDTQKVDYVKQAANLLATLPGAAEREIYARRVAAETGLSADMLLTEVKRLHGQLKKKKEKDQSRSETQARNLGQSPVAGVRYENPASAAAERAIISILLLDPELSSRPDLPEPEEFTSPPLSHIYAAVRDLLRGGQEATVNSLACLLSGPEMNLLVSILHEPVSSSNAAMTLNDCLNKMKKEKIHSAQDMLAHRRAGVDQERK